MSSQSMRVLTLLARNGITRYGDASKDVRTFFAHQMPEVAHEIVVIDNALRSSYEERVGSDTIIGGDNSAWEFSAWDRGVDWLGPRLDKYDFVHLATSAFRQLYVRYLDRFDADMLSLVRGRAAAVGHIDFYNNTVMLSGYALQSWLRSSFIFLPSTEVRLLGSLVSVTDRSPFFSGDAAAPFHAEAPLSESYRQNILGWLTGQGTGQGMEWHSRFALCEESLGFFEDKATAILNEQMLTSRLRAQGCNIVDATWLATYAERFYPDGRTLKALPDWRAQVAGRDIDAAPVAILP